MPRQNIIEASVMMKGGISSLAMITPLIVPISTPMPMVMTMAAHSGQPLMRIMYEPISE